MTIKHDSRHLYIQVMDELKQKIKKGILKENEKLPSEFQFAKQLGVSRATLREALRTLESENVVRRKHGVGTFVNAKPVFSSGIEELYSITYMIQQSGKQAGSNYLTLKTITPTDNDLDRFAPNHINNLLEIRRVRTADGDPVVFCIDQLPENLVSYSDIQKEDSLFKVLEEQAGKRITYAVTYIEPITDNDDVSEWLACEPDQSLLVLKQTHYTANDEPVLYSVNYFRPDFFRFHVLRKR